MIDNSDIAQAGITHYDIKDGKIRLWKYDTNPNDFGWKYAIKDEAPLHWRRWPNSHLPMTVSRI